MIERQKSIFAKISLVRQIPLFKKLNIFELQMIAAKATIADFTKGELVRKQGDPPDAFYCLLNGRLKAFSTREGERYEDVEYIHRGMHFGIISTFTGQPHSLSFEVINDSLIMKIPREDFLQILKAIPHLGITFSKSLSRRIRSKVTHTKSIFESSILSVYSAVNAVGSSTYAYNLACGLKNQTQKKIMLLKLMPRDGIGDCGDKTIFLKEIIEEEERINQSIFPGHSGIDVVQVCFEREDISLVNKIGHFVSNLAVRYHYVVVDLPNAMDDIVLKVLTQSDIIHLISFDRKQDLHLTRDVINRLKGALAESFDPEKVRVFISGVTPQTYLSFEQINKEINYPVFMMLPHLRRDDFSLERDASGLTIAIPAAATDYAKTITRISRTIGGVLTGLVLGGGAALGLAHIGVLKYIEEENIPIDIIAGSSIGALIGSLWATGMRADEIETLAKSFTKKDSMWQIIDIVLSPSGFIGGRAIVRWLHKQLKSKTFYSTTIPLKIVAYDLSRREDIVIDSGSLVDAVRKSISIPGVLKPVREKGRIIIDGGVLNPMPTNVLSRMGIKKIIAVNVLQSPEDVCAVYIEQHKELEKKGLLVFWKNPKEWLSFQQQKLFKKMFYPNISDIIINTLMASEYVIAQQSAELADVMIHPELAGINWYELFRAEELITAGKDAARKAFLNLKNGG